MEAFAVGPAEGDFHSFAVVYLGSVEAKKYTDKELRRFRKSDKSLPTETELASSTICANHLFWNAQTADILSRFWKNGMGNSSGFYSSGPVNAAITHVWAGEQLIEVPRKAIQLLPTIRDRRFAMKGCPHCGAPGVICRRADRWEVTCMNHLDFPVGGYADVEHLGKFHFQLDDWNDDDTWIEMGADKELVKARQTFSTGITEDYRESDLDKPIQYQTKIFKKIGPIYEANTLNIVEIQDKAAQQAIRELMMYISKECGKVEDIYWCASRNDDVPYISCTICGYNGDISITLYQEDETILVLNPLEGDSFELFDLVDATCFLSHLLRNSRVPNVDVIPNGLHFFGEN
jgi:hypothetical protein